MGVDLMRIDLVAPNQLDSSNYFKLAHLLSFLGTKEQSTVVLDDEIRLLLDLYVHFERPRPGPFN